MHLIILAPDLHASPTAAALWGDFAPLIRAENASDHRLVLVHGDDADTPNPRRLTEHAFCPPGHLMSRPQPKTIWQRLGSIFAKPAEPVPVPTLPDAVLLDYLLEDSSQKIVNELSGEARKYAVVHIDPEVKTNTVWINSGKQLVCDSLRFLPEQFDYAAVPGTDADWRFLYLGHELGHTQRRHVDSQHPAARMREEMHCDNEAERIYHAARSLKPDMDAAVPSFMQDIRCISSLFVVPSFAPHYVNFPSMTPFNGLFSNDNNGDAIRADYVSLASLLNKAAKESGINHLPGYVVAAAMLEETGLMTPIQEEMLRQFQAASIRVFNAGVVPMMLNYMPRMLADIEQQRHEVRQLRQAGDIAAQYNFPQA